MSLEKVEAILATALRHGIRFFDCAVIYGDSERRLGDYRLAERRPDVEISTKIPIVSRDLWSRTDAYRLYLRELIAGSRERLRVPKLELLQFHQHDCEFLENPSVARVMEELITDGLCTSIGISVYTPGEAVAALELPALAAIQVPINLIDRRFFSDELVARYRRKGVRVIGRSIFLQGILIEGAKLVPAKRAAALAEVKALAVSTAKKLGWSLHELALAYALRGVGDSLDIVLVGVDSPESLEENFRLSESPSFRSPTREEIDAFDSVTELAAASDVLDPTRWNLA